MSALLGINESQLEMAMNVPVLQAPANNLPDTWHYNQASNLSQSLPYLGGVAANTMLLNAGLSTQAIVGIGAVTGGGFDAVGQYVDTNGFTTGNWRPMQTAASTITGGLLAPYAVSYGVVGHTLLGAGISTANTSFNNLYYQYDPTYQQKDFIGEAVKGALGGVAGYYAGGNITNYYTTPIIRNQSILFQNYNNPIPSLIGNTVGSSVSGATPIVIDYLNQDNKK